jgi:hypothetical protein
MAVEDEFILFRPLVSGVYSRPSAHYRNRFELRFYGRAGATVKNWIRETYGAEDDMVYASNLGHGADTMDYYESMVSYEQLVFLVLKFL